MKLQLTDLLVTISQNKVLRNILLFSIFVVVLFPAFEQWVSYPKFADLLIRSTENSAERAATHLSKNLLALDDNLYDEKLPPEFIKELAKTTLDFQIEKIKLFTSSGKVIYSSDKDEVGLFNTHDYFRNTIAQGTVYTKIVHKGQKTLENRTVIVDVIETYIPIIQHGLFVGAFEIYYDVTDQKGQLDGLLHKSSLVLTAIAAGLLLAVLMLVIAASHEITVRTISQNHQSSINAILNISLEPISLPEQLTSILDTILELPWLAKEKQGAIFLYHPAKKELVMEVQKGLAKPLLALCANIPLGHCLCGKAAESKRIIFAHHGDKQHVIQHEQMQPHAHYCIPIISSENLLGVIILYVTEHHPYDADETKLLGTIGTTIAGIIERKQMEEELRWAKERAEQSDRTKSSFLAMMSHEIRTPLNSIIGLNEHLLEDEENIQRRHYLELAKIGGETLLSLINDILDLSKIDADQLELETTHFNLFKLVSDTGKIVRNKAEEKGLAIKISVAPNVPTATIGDPQRLQQVLLNLLGNAIKFTEMGLITIDLQRDQNGPIHFTVADTGIGIAQESAETIFQPFTQADNSTTRRFGGTGLGLDICRRLVNLMGGRIWVESIEGQGSHFHFTAQLSESSETLQTLDRRSHLCRKSNRPIQPLQILLAEDVEENITVLQAFLGKTPHQLDIVNNGQQAVEKFQLGLYDLVLMDIQMPVMDGFTATRKIRAWEQTNHLPTTPILALTAHALQKVTQDILEAGCNMHLTKPISKSRLLGIVNHFASQNTQGLGMELDRDLSVIASEMSRGDEQEPTQSNRAASHHPSAEKQSLNQTTLNQLRQDLGGHIERPINRFLEHLPIRVADISHATAHQDTTLLENVAHKLKGTSATIGAEQLAALANTLEGIGKSGILSEVTTPLDDLKAEAEKVEKLLAHHLQHTAHT